MKLLWEEYLYWKIQDKKTLKRINALIKDIQRNTFEGIGKPELPKYIAFLSNYNQKYSNLNRFSQ